MEKNHYLSKASKPSWLYLSSTVEPNTKLNTLNQTYMMNPIFVFLSLKAKVSVKIGYICDKLIFDSIVLESQLFINPINLILKPVYKYKNV